MCIEQGLKRGVIVKEDRYEEEREVRREKERRRERALFAGRKSQRTSSADWS